MTTHNKQFKPGISPNPVGRPKGAKNKVSMEVVKEIRDAAVARGGSGGVRAWLKSLDDRTFAMLFGKVVPKDINLNANVTGIDDLLKAHASRKT